MSKWSGKIGYSVTEEDPIDSGIYVEKITERSYRGDLLSIRYQNRNVNQVNDDVIFSNQFSIVADAFAISNIHTLKYITFKGVKWKISSVELQYPRILITISDVYNGGGGPSEQ